VRERGGWSFYSAPDWFVQGSEEWVARLAHENVVDIHSAARSRALKPASGAIATRAGKLWVADPYREGEALIAWLVIRQGEDVVHQILNSPQRTFADALGEATTLREAELAAEYWAWRGGQE
jgi:hypothetical protein